MNPTEFYINALTGDPNTPMDWRLIHDKDRENFKPFNLRGTYAELAGTLHAHNQQGYGVFVNINAMKPIGDDERLTLDHVEHIRTHVVDLDDPLNSAAGYERAITSELPPQMVVQSSPQKYHLYWLVEPYTGNDFYTQHQRKLAQLYNGDPSIIDATRIMRVPGFLHNKNEPVLATVHAGADHPRYTFEQIQSHLAAVNVIQHETTRHPLGDSKLAAPSLSLLIQGLNLINPTELDYHEWMATSAAFKQAGWTLTDEATLRAEWDKWCESYPDNNPRENDTVWGSFHDTQVGWSRFKRLTNISAYEHFPEQPVPTFNTPPPPPAPEQELPKYLDPWGKAERFKDCVYIERMGAIFTPSGRFMKETQFNGTFGGHEFSLRDAGGKSTDKAWAGALYATDFCIPKVDHVRFLPSSGTKNTITDDLGRKGLNIYIPAIIKQQQGDVSMWLDFLNRILATPDDVKIFDDYLAHCIKYPGHKIPWAILLQSAEGIGKKMIGKILKHCIGQSYVYQPKADELISGGARFNAWMRARLLIMVDEIRVGERHELVEALKPLITDEYVAVEGKGVDQDMEDNVANWLFFSNYKDAIPVKNNGRRYCVFFSPLQTSKSIQDVGMTKEYFDRMYAWLDNGGYEAIAYYYLNHSVVEGSLPHRAPKTSSHTEALKIGRSPVEVIIDEKIAAGERGFRNGYISWPMLLKTIDSSKIRSAPPEHALRSILESRDYVELGYYHTVLPTEDMGAPPLLFGLDGVVDSVDYYEVMQNV